MKGVNAVPRANCLGEAAAPEFTVSKIVKERGNQPDLIIQVSTQNQRLAAVSDGRMDNEWMEGWIGRLAICAQEPTSRRFSDNMGEETMHSSPNRNEDQSAHFHLP